MKITYGELATLVDAVAEDNNLQTVDDLFDYLSENDHEYFRIVRGDGESDA